MILLRVNHRPLNHQIVVYEKTVKNNVILRECPHYHEFIFKIDILTYILLHISSLAFMFPMGVSTTLIVHYKKHISHLLSYSQIYIIRTGIVCGALRFFDFMCSTRIVTCE